MIQTISHLSIGEEATVWFGMHHRSHLAECESMLFPVELNDPSTRGPWNTDIAAVVTFDKVGNDDKTSPPYLSNEISRREGGWCGEG